MGGYGSGRWPINYEKKEVVGNCLPFSVFQMRRQGLLQPSLRSEAVLIWQRKSLGERHGSIGLFVDTVSERPFVRLAYQIHWWGGSEESLDYTVNLISTPCNFGGRRFWFECPAIIDTKPCLRRVGKLYLPPGGIILACRACHQLTYRACQEKHDDYESKQFDMQRNGDSGTNDEDAVI